MADFNGKRVRVVGSGSLEWMLKAKGASVVKGWVDPHEPTDALMVQVSDLLDRLRESHGNVHIDLSIDEIRADVGERLSGVFEEIVVREFGGASSVIVVVSRLGLMSPDQRNVYDAVSQELRAQTAEFATVASDTDIRINALIAPWAPVDMETLATRASDESGSFVVTRSSSAAQLHVHQTSLGPLFDMLSELLSESSTDTGVVFEVEGV